MSGQIWSLNDGSIVKGAWLVDTGASRHMTKHKEDFINLAPCPTVNIRCGNGGIITANQKGTCRISLQIDGKPEVIQLQEVLFMPALGDEDSPTRVISVNQLARKGFEFTFRAKDFKIK